MREPHNIPISDKPYWSYRCQDQQPPAPSSLRRDSTSGNRQAACHSSRRCNPQRWNPWSAPRTGWGTWTRRICQWAQSRSLRRAASHSTYQRRCRKRRRVPYRWPRPASSGPSRAWGQPWWSIGRGRQWQCGVEGRGGGGSWRRRRGRGGEWAGNWESAWRRRKRAGDENEVVGLRQCQVGLAQLFMSPLFPCFYSAYLPLITDKNPIN